MTVSEYLKKEFEDRTRIAKELKEQEMKEIRALISENKKELERIKITLSDKSQHCYHKFQITNWECDFIECYLNVDICCEKCHVVYENVRGKE